MDMKLLMPQLRSQPKEVRYELSSMFYNGADALLFGESICELGFEVPAHS